MEETKINIEEETTEKGEEKILMRGDFNARLGDKGTRIKDKEKGEKRESKDKANNKERKILWKIIEEMGWEILNGNKEGDEEGEWTYVGAKGESIIDYEIVNEEAWEEIESFKVGERVESDRMPLEIKIKGKEQEYEKQDRRNERKEIEKRIWDEEGIQRHRSRLEKKKFEVKEDTEATIAELIYIWQGRNNGWNGKCSELKRKAREK
ncbi:hypothetical protein Zmor_000572 [Zophobas morio]|uniref:Endonuclease/exonuclease/phosphatase domain-containing protein n=1 Tax=Zophobas morio TaxID=2755281 RepID=A0AA38J096_9CUCU|nr:hypothetical protein Zmor_000572 [Zophobas morio]